MLSVLSPLPEPLERVPVLYYMMDYAFVQNVYECNVNECNSCENDTVLYLIGKA